MKASRSRKPQRNIRVVAIRRDPPDFKLLSRALIRLAEQLARQDVQKLRDKPKKGSTQ